MDNKTPIEMNLDLWDSHFFRISVDQKTLFFSGLCLKTLNRLKTIFMFNPIKKLVSKNKRRYVDDQFDLDLTYITDRIIAMGFPSSNLESIYRNNKSDVIRFLNTNHQNHYKVFNLCSEKSYNHDIFDGRVARFPFDDHQSPPFNLISKFCQSADEWINDHQKNIIVVHCKAGKGRTGLMICAYLLHSKFCANLPDALNHYASTRTFDGKGVTIPSQLRYIGYYDLVVKQVIDIKEQVIILKRLDFTNFKGKNLVQPSIQMKMHNAVVYNGVPIAVVEGSNINLSFGNGIPLKGDVNIKVAMRGKCIGSSWLNVNFLSGNKVIIMKNEIDNVSKGAKELEFQIHYEIIYPN